MDNAGFRQQDQLDFVFKNMDDSVCITNKLGELYYFNDAAGRLLGISDDQVRTEKIWKLIPYVETNDDLIQLFIDATVAKEKTFQNIVNYEKNDGTVCRIRVNITYSDAGEDKQFFTIVITNLTELFRVNAAFERYTSAEIADYVLNTPDGEKSGGKQCDVTILMSDLRGFTALSTKLHPDRLIELLNHYFERMLEVINKYHGTVIEFLGDGIFTVFGAPKDNPDHARDAVCCAIEMENAMEEVNRWNLENDYPELQMGIGINSGVCVVGNIGSSQRMKYGCMGETVNIAGRVESFTVGGRIYISERTRERIEDELEIGDELSFMPKGAREELSIYGIEGIGGLKLTDVQKEIEWLGRSGSKEVRFRELSGKAVGDEEYTGRVTDLSSDTHYARLVTDASLKKAMNIMIEIGGDLYAKVTGVGESDYVLCFTAKPDNFKPWSEWE